MTLSKSRELPRQPVIVRSPSPVLWVVATAALTALCGGCTKPNAGFDERYLPDTVGTYYDVSVDGVGEAHVAPDDAGAADVASPPGRKPNGVDVLLVVDNSSDMAMAQTRLARDIGALLEPLAALPGSVRVGVVSTDMGTGQYAANTCKSGGDEGKLRRAPLCNKTGRAYAELLPGGDVDELVKEATCLVAVGKTGCGFEQPLAALRAALTQGASPMLRKDAALAIVVLTTEDDCSAQNIGLFDWQDSSLGPYSDYRCFNHGVLCNGKAPALSSGKLSSCVPGQSWLYDVKSHYADFARNSRDLGWVSVAVIGGPPAKTYEIGRRYDKFGYPIYYVEPTCTEGSAIQGRPALRLHSFADAFGTSGVFGTICAASYEPVLGQLATRIKAAF